MAGPSSPRPAEKAGPVASRARSPNPALLPSPNPAAAAGLSPASTRLPPAPGNTPELGPVSGDQLESPTIIPVVPELPLPIDATGADLSPDMSKKDRNPQCLAMLKGKFGNIRPKLKKGVRKARPKLLTKTTLKPLLGGEIAEQVADLLKLAAQAESAVPNVVPIGVPIQA